VRDSKLVAAVATLSSIRQLMMEQGREAPHGISLGRQLIPVSQHVPPGSKNLAKNMIFLCTLQLLSHEVQTTLPPVMNCFYSTTLQRLFLFDLI
jgi:hypothetical protein